MTESSAAEGTEPRDTGPGPAEQGVPPQHTAARDTGPGPADAADQHDQNRPVHFEIHAADPDRAVAFYRDVFGWEAEDWSEYANTPYFGLRTGTGHGIDGAIMRRLGEDPMTGGVVAGAVLTIGVTDYDATAERILAAGGTEALPKYALAGMAWQGYFHDTANNVFGIHQPDPNAA